MGSIRFGDLALAVSGDLSAESQRIAIRAGDIDFTRRGTIRGEADGTVEFVMDGAVHSTFLTAGMGSACFILSQGAPEGPAAMPALSKRIPRKRPARPAGTCHKEAAK